jgi:capsular exopolysaccharide synthesis family protein
VRPGGLAALKDARSFVALLRRRWLILLSIATGVALAVVAAALLITPMWSATAQIKIDPNRRSPIEFKTEPQVGPPDQALVDTEVGIIQSPDVARGVVERLDLSNDPDFRPKPGLLAKLIGAGEPSATVGDPVGAAAERLLKYLDVSRSGTTYLIELTFHSPDPAKAAQIANAFARQYMTSSMQTRAGDAADQSATLSRQLDKLGAEVQAADSKVAQYRARVGIVEGGANGTITDQQIAPLSSQLATAESQAAAAQANLTAARAQIAQGGLEAVSGVLNSDVIADLRRQRAEVLRLQGETSARYGPRHPQFISLAQQLSDIDKQIRDESQRIVSGIESQAAAASASAAALRRELARLKSEQAGNTSAAVIAGSLERQAEAKRTVFDQLAQAAQQTSQQRQGAEPLGRIVGLATPPLRPSFPNKPLFAILGVILGTVAGLAVVLVIEAFDVKVRTTEDIVEGLGIPFIASLPRLSSRKLKLEDGGLMPPWDYPAVKPMSEFAEALRTARSTMILSETGQKPKIIAIASALPAEGKTSFAASLARIMALSGDRTVLVDCDLRRNALQSLAPANPAGGLIELLDGAISLDDALVRDEATGLDVLPLAGASFTPKDMFNGEPTERLLRTLSERYDHVILDTPPLLAVADARGLARLADAVILLIRWNSTSRFAVKAAVERLRQNGTRITGAVLSMAEHRAGAISETDAAYYQKSYAAYYSG